MHARDGDVERAAVHGDIPRRGELRLPRRRALRQHHRLLAGAGDGRDRTVAQVDPAHRVVFVVRDVEVVAVERHALRLVELGLAGRAVAEAGSAAADHERNVALNVGDQHAVVVGVGDREAPASVIPLDLAGEGEHAVGAGFAGDFERLARERAGAFVLVDHRVDDGDRLRGGQLALVPADHVAARVDEEERGPGARAVALPVLEIGVVEDGVLDPQAQHGLAQVAGLALGRELGRMDGDDLDGGRMAALDLPQLREHVHAVDSSVGPEVQDQQPPGEIVERQRAARVDPLEPVRNFRRALLPERPHVSHRAPPPSGRRLIGRRDDPPNRLALREHEQSAL